MLKQDKVWITNKYDTSCKKCKANVKAGVIVLWVPGNGILCEDCSGKEKQR